MFEGVFPDIASPGFFYGTPRLGDLGDDPHFQVSFFFLNSDVLRKMKINGDFTVYFI